MRDLYRFEITWYLIASLLALFVFSPPEIAVVPLDESFDCSTNPCASPSLMMAGRISGEGG